MGTSKNVRSPDIPPWKPFLAVVGRPDIPVERQARELWRAAYAERGPRLEDDFSQRTLAVACELADSRRSIQAALHDYDAANQRERRAGLGVELGRRALVRAIARGTGAAGFAADLFADASSYYASRDLPSFIGAAGRVHNTSSAIELKNAISRVTREQVSKVGMPGTDAEGWASFVRTALMVLRGGR
jgi:hypothetical protein